MTNLKGDVSIGGVRRVELVDIGGDVTLHDIGIGVDIEKIGEAVALKDLRGDVRVDQCDCAAFSWFHWQ